MGFIAAMCGFLKQTLPIYFDIVAHQPGKVPISQTDAFPPSNAFFMGSTLWIPCLVRNNGGYLDHLDARKS